MGAQRIGASALALSMAISSLVTPARAGAQDYRFELVGQPKAGQAGKAVIAVRLVRISDSKPVLDAVVFEMKADMGPAGMPTMTAPIKAAPGSAGAYSFEVEPGMTGKWAITLAAKVQGEAETVRGSIVADLVK